MTPRPTPPIERLGPGTQYVVDTGPLLCLGASKVLRDLVKPRCHGATDWVAAVKAELEHRSRGHGPVASAARSYAGTGASWLPPAIAFTAADESDLTPIHDHLRRLAAAKSGSPARNMSTDPRAHLGEAQSILHATRHARTLLAHDTDARTVAGARGIASATLVDLARRFVSEGESPKRLSSEFQILSQDGFDADEYVRSQLDLYPRRFQG